MKGLLKWGGGVLVAGLALLLVYGVAVEPRFILDERRYTVGLAGLGEGWAGAEVAVFADLQVGMWLANTHMVERVVARVVEARGGDDPRFRQARHETRPVCGGAGPCTARAE